MHGMVFQPINMKNEQNITGSNTLTEDTPAPADNTPGGTKTAKKMTRRVLIGGGIGTLAVAFLRRQKYPLPDTPHPVADGVFHAISHGIACVRPLQSPPL